MFSVVLKISKQFFDLELVFLMVMYRVFLLNKIKLLNFKNRKRLRKSSLRVVNLLDIFCLHVPKPV